MSFVVLLQAAEEPVDDLMDLVKQIVPFHVKVVYGITGYYFFVHQFCMSACLVVDLSERHKISLWCFKLSSMDI